jgi:hypothetical protein
LLERLLRLAIRDECGDHAAMTAARAGRDIGDQFDI